ncbi:MAG: FG-GAP-like repeat-containing protein [Candidatus Hodarchaeales archaeon]
MKNNLKNGCIVLIMAIFLLFPITLVNSNDIMSENTRELETPMKSLSGVTYQDSHSFVPKYIYSNPYFSDGITLGRFHPDGKLRMITGCGQSGSDQGARATVYKQVNYPYDFELETSFNITWGENVGYDYYRPRLSHDFDGDGVEEVLGYLYSSQYSTNAIILGWNGTGYSSKWLDGINGINTYGSAQLCDIDRDGLLELVSNSRSTTYVHSWDKSGNFTLEATLMGGAWYDVGIGDIDNDGEDEIITSEQDGPTVRIYGYNNGNYELEVEQQFQSIGYSSFTVADFDGDDLVEIITGSPNVGGGVYPVTYFQWNEATSDLSGTNLTILDVSQFAFKAGDIDGDGLDEAITSLNGGERFVVEQASNGTLVYQRYSFGYSNEFVLFDFDNDNNKELVFPSTNKIYDDVNGISPPFPLPLHGKVSRSFDTGGNQGLTNNGTFLFSTSNSNSQMNIYDYDQGTVVDSSYVGVPMGAAFDGEYLYIGDSNNPGDIHRYYTNGTLYNTYTTTYDDLAGLAWYDGDLWLSRYNTGEIIRYNLSTGYISNISTNLGLIWGLASDGTHLYAVGGKNTSTTGFPVIEVFNATGDKLSEFAVCGLNGWQGLTFWRNKLYLNSGGLTHEIELISEDDFLNLGYEDQPTATTLDFTGVNVKWKATRASRGWVRMSTNLSALESGFYSEYADWDGSMVFDCYHDINITGLSPGTTYYYYVYSDDDMGTSRSTGRSDIQQFTTGSPVYFVGFSDRVDQWNGIFYDYLVVSLTFEISNADDYSFCLELEYDGSKLIIDENYNLFEGTYVFEFWYLAEDIINILDFHDGHFQLTDLFVDRYEDGWVEVLHINNLGQTGYYSRNDFVSEPSLALLGNFTDYIDYSNGSSALIISCQVMVYETGNYIINAELDTEYGTFVTYINHTSIYLYSGESWVDLRFNGADIFYHGYDGRYRLQYIGIFREDDWRGDEMSSAYLTAHYDHNMFNPAVVKPIKFMNEFSDPPLPEPGSKMMELVIDYRVNVYEPGNYLLEAELRTLGDIYVSSISEIVYFSGGLYWESLRFPGIEIYNSNYDGQFLLTRISASLVSDSSRGDEIWPNWYTRYYNHDDFVGGTTKISSSSSDTSSTIIFSNPSFSFLIILLVIPLLPYIKNNRKRNS